MASGNAEILARELLEVLITPTIQLRLREFIRQAWSILEPRAIYSHNWHIDFLAEYLEAAARREIRNIIINIPPRCMKSLLVSVLFPAWVWSYEPSSRFICLSHTRDGAIRDALKMRRLIESEWYQSEFGKVFHLTSDQNVKTRYENDRTGFRFSTGITGPVTGDGGDFILLDDLLKAQDANSPAKRKQVNDAYDLAISTRANDPKAGVKIIIMQRLHEEDTTGHILSQMENEGSEQYEYVCLPMEYEPNRFISSIGLKDPRTKPGELLWPNRYGMKEVNALKVTLGDRGYAGQMQQRPYPAGGSIFKEEWFQYISVIPHELLVMRVRYWDKAATKDGGDYTAGCLMSLTRDGRYIIEHVLRGQWSSQERDKMMLETAKNDAMRDRLQGNWVRTQIWHPQDPGSAGKDSAKATNRLLAGYPAHFETVSGSKEVRADPLSSQFEAGVVYLTKGAWNAAFRDELLSFPNGSHDDQVDAVAGAFSKLVALATVSVSQVSGKAAELLG